MIYEPWNHNFVLIFREYTDVTHFNLLNVLKFKLKHGQNVCLSLKLYYESKFLKFYYFNTLHGKKSRKF